MANRTEQDLTSRMQSLIVSDPALAQLFRQHLRLVSGIGAYGPLTDPDYVARATMTGKQYREAVNQSYATLVQAFAERGLELPKGYSLQVGVDPTTREPLAYVKQAEWLVRNDQWLFPAMAGGVVAPAVFGWGAASAATQGGATGGGAATGGAAGAAGGAGAAATTAAAVGGWGLKDYLALGLTLGGLGLDVFGTIKAGNEAKELAELNAKAAEAQAADALERGREEESAFRTGVETLISEQRAGFAGQNVDVGIGTPVDVQMDAAYLGEIDALTIRRNAKREADARLREADILRKGGQAAQTASRYNAAGTVLSGTSMLATRYGWGA